LLFLIGAVAAITVLIGAWYLLPLAARYLALFEVASQEHFWAVVYMVLTLIVIAAAISLFGPPHAARRRRSDRLNGVGNPNHPG